MEKVIMILSTHEINLAEAKKQLREEGYEVVDFGVATNGYSYESDKAMNWLHRVKANKFVFVNSGFY
jgi:hypothetical protein